MSAAWKNCLKELEMPGANETDLTVALGPELLANWAKQRAAIRDEGFSAGWQVGRLAEICYCWT